MAPPHNANAAVRLLSDAVLGNPDILSIVLHAAKDRLDLWTLCRLSRVSRTFCAAIATDEVLFERAIRHLPSYTKTAVCGALCLRSSDVTLIGKMRHNPRTGSHWIEIDQEDVVALFAHHGKLEGRATRLHDFVRRGWTSFYCKRPDWLLKASTE